MSFEQLLVGRTIAGRYQIDALLGRGGMGAVSRADGMANSFSWRIHVLASNPEADVSMNEENTAKCAFPAPHPGVLGFIAPWASHVARHVPRAAQLRDLLLGYGGYEVSFPMQIGATEHAAFERLLSSAQLHRMVDTLPSVGSGDVRSFALLTWGEAPKARAVMQGYALDHEGVWKEHTWVEESGRVLDMSPGHCLFYGSALDAESTLAQWRDVAASRENSAASLAAWEDERERERAAAGPQSVGEALCCAEGAESTGDLDGAERMLIRAIRLAAETGNSDELEAQAAYASFMIRCRDPQVGVDVLRDLIRVAGDGFNHAVAPLRTIVMRMPESEAVSALRSLDLAEHVHESSLLKGSERAAKSGRFRVAETLARLVMEYGRARGDDHLVWHGQGQLGRVYEREGRIAEAIELWREAFLGGSANWQVADRLTLHLERSREYAACARTCRDALRRINHPGTTALLQQRLRRVEKKLA